MKEGAHICKKTDKNKKKITFAEYFYLHSAKRAFGKGTSFAECISLGTRQRRPLCRVPDLRHSAKLGPLPSACDLALGKDGCFAECQITVFAECLPFGTRQS